jgi:hypothetical protein
MSMNSDPHGVVELSGWPDAAALIRWREEGPQLGEARVLLPPPPASYWHSTALQEDRHFDADARNRSVAFQRKYLEEFRQLERAPYPPHLVVMPHTGLPALLNDYLPDFALAEDRDKLGELVQQWLAQESLDLALFGVSPDQLFQPAGPESRRRLEYRGALQLGFPEVGDKAQSRSDSVQQRDTLHFHYQQFYAGKWPVYGGRVVVHCGFGDPRVSVSSSYFPLREDKPFDPRLTDVEARDIAMQVLRRYVGDRFKKKPIIAMVPYAGSAQFITAYRDHFCLAYRFEVTNELGDEAWRVFVDAESGLVLGPPEQLTAQARAYYFGSSAAARQLKQTFDPSLTLAQLKTGLDPYCSSLETVVGTVLDLTGFQDPPKLPPPVDEFEAANIAFHAWRTLAHFMTACGVASLQLEAYGYAYEVWEEAGLMEEKVTKTGTLSRPLRLVVGKADGDVLQMGFVSAEEINPKTIIFQTATEPPTFRVDGNLVHNPSLDPEVIAHELAHAIMWLVHRAPFVENGSSVPFRQALLEGYATYFARSLAARLANDAQDNPTALWAGSAYRANDWQDRWGFARATQIVGADALADPNLYPASATTGVGVYDLSMVLARALWDIRKLIPDNAWGGLSGPDLADRLALEGYTRCHGWITNFQIAAEGVLDSARQKNLNSALIGQMTAAFQSRHILP